ncbi:MAG TPA: LysR family transcriptional regulator [Amaricoccus sp.]|uniref:LysR family transcriptional regulator n=1 Tax=Amaricoccus sp. TaxID=1872485 RepID=UPI001D311084|nr:LysR family transcriptional regulator [Amaricoccus sp.]MCB1404065.1 LysR family transcriptional regulator [Paracoccaceae bacterium]MCC0065493.1 LysR family transcriptional regulator [Rhodovulum sp.]HPG21471.1 LysR family transcriptional regulator [Amaricoccus sp.]HRW16700.1 LysR family transcriptional regulator [Amaricoccus sp.]
MLEIKDMKLLAALARHRHFARAAAASGISQPAFSARIRKIEASFGLPLVRRGNKFQGFSREGEVLLKWCRKILADVEGMRQEMEMSKGALGGKLVIGAVPTALPYAALLSGRLREVHPDLAIEIRSLTSSKIGLGLDDYSLDAGLTYVGAENIGDKLLLEPIYEETYVLVASKALAPRAAGHATWAEAAALPLCLLTRDMRNRQLIDAAFEAVGLNPSPVMETDDFTAALAQVASGTAAMIAPRWLSDNVFAGRDSIRLELTDPVVAHSIGLVTHLQDPVLPAIAALRDAIRSLS